MFMNEHDIAAALVRFDSDDTPNLREATQTLAKLATWVNNNSDGWPYWSKPLRASAKLQGIIEARTRDYFRGVEVADITAAELRTALTPVKSFLTRQGVDWREVL